MEIEPDIQQDENRSSSHHRFAQRAMATVFEILIDHEDQSYARQTAYAAFEELQRLEEEISRFIETSDVSLINKTPVNTPVQVGNDTLRCLQLAEQFYTQTNGVFNITAGKIIDRWKKQEEKNPGKDNVTSNQFGLNINTNEMTVSRQHDDVLIDLGGLGKGYALDRMKTMLEEWDINRAMLHSGWSTILTLDPPHTQDGWNLTLRHPHSQELLQTVSLSHQAISGSGVQKGSHIINPKTGKAVSHTLAAWVTANSAAAADAFSTACMILPATDREKLCHANEISSPLVLPQ